MKRSEMIEIIGDYFYDNGFTKDQLSGENESDFHANNILNIIEKNGMLPPSRGNHFHTVADEIDCTWEPENET